MLIRGLFRQEIGSLQPGPKLDETAPDFTLKTNDGKAEITLSKQIGPKPVVLIFGNFTCGPFRSQAGNFEKLHRRYKDRANFLMVYVREAHPTDGWRMESNDRVGVATAQPSTYDERAAVAQRCGKLLGLGFPLLVDTIDDAVGARYSGMPGRFYLIDREGKIAFKSGRGPYGFKPDELEQSLVLMLQDEYPEATAKPSTPVTQAVQRPIGIDRAEFLPASRDHWAVIDVNAGADSSVESEVTCSARQTSRFRERKIAMASDEVITNQESILGNQEKILANQESIEKNQAKLDKIAANQAAILANQESIRDNQKKLDKILANQATIEANQASILANQDKLDRTVANQAIDSWPTRSTSRPTRTRSRGQKEMSPTSARSWPTRRRSSR